MNFTIRPVAREDILQQFRYYLIEKESEATAERFLEAVQQAIGDVCQRPTMGTPKILQNRALQSLRTWPVKGFPSIRIYYLFQEDTLRVIRVLHGKRDVDPMLEEDGGPF
ncbi:MAG: type II toxin-antitoxin system RelE/ParE family toxin [Acidobacteriales bacterium]|nr:type II toxin-antitoxin system RelE/ParE family toxin [Terriglobales bacterium]